MEIKKYSSPNKFNGRNGWKPDMIVCHITEGGFDGAVNWLCNSISEASAHFVVAKDGRVAQLVDITNASWCNGTSVSQSDSRFYGKSTLSAVRERKTNANYYTTTIEHEGLWTNGKGALTNIQLETTVLLMQYIQNEVKAKYGIQIPLDREHIVGHSEINPVSKPLCPGENYPFLEIIRRLNQENTQEEKIEEINVKIMNRIYPMHRVLINDYNYIMLQDFKQTGCTVEYDSVNKIPILNFPS